MQYLSKTSDFRNEIEMENFNAFILKKCIIEYCGWLSYQYVYYKICQKIAGYKLGAQKSLTVLV
jgi:hypothetical protein